MRKLSIVTLALVGFGLVATLWIAKVRAAASSVTFTFTRVVELQCDEGVGESCPNDYYPKVDIDAQGLDDGKDRFCCAHGTDFQPNWVFSRSVDTSHNPFSIHVELWDQDDLSPDDQIDIANGPSSLDITVNLNNCTWQGGGLTGLLNTQSSSQGSGSDSAKIYFMINVPSVSCNDSDGDGLLDVWETNGLDVDGDGVIDVNLPAMGANPQRKDLFLEIDYLQAANHTHAPIQAAVQQVVQAFADAPVGNPDGTTGIQLHVDVGSLYGVGNVINVPRTGGGGVAGNFGDFGGGGNQIPEAGNTIIDYVGGVGGSTNFFSIKNLNANRTNVFRYATFIHQTNARAAVNDCTSGLAKGIPGVNFFVSLGGVRGTTGNPPCWGTDATGQSVGTQNQQAGTLMHEFGHTLGLQHGGGDGLNNKPNYLSVMNYTWQACQVPARAGAGIPGGCDYSRVLLPAGVGLNENSLDECQGIDNGAFGLGPVDWNANSALNGVSNCSPPNNTNVQANINADTSNDLNKNGTQDPGEPPIFGTLNGFQDWNAIVYNFRTIFDFTTAGAPTEQEPDSLTIESSRARMTEQLKPGLLLDKTGPADGQPGDTLSYNIKLENKPENSGRGPALNVVLTDTKPDSSTQVVNIPTVVLGATSNNPISYQVPCSTTDRTVLTNTAQADAVDLLSNPYSLIDSVNTTIHTPVLVLSKTATATVNGGEAISYTISYENTGSGAATNVVITDTVPAGVYYSIPLDQGIGPQPTTVTLNANGSRTLVWNIGTVTGNSGLNTIGFTARPTLLALGGTSYTNNVSLGFKNANGCAFSGLTASAATSITVANATLDPLGSGFWWTHPELETAEILARIQATDQRYDGADRTTPNGALTLAEVAAALNPGGNMQKVLLEQLLATYFNLGTRRVNAATVISSKIDTSLDLKNVRDSVLYAHATLPLPVNASNRSRYSNATDALEEVNEHKSLP